MTPVATPSETPIAEPLTNDAAPRGNYRHGCRSTVSVHPSEDPSEFHGLLADLLNHHRPGDLTEERLVREMAESEFRLRRVRALMDKALSAQMEKVRVQLLADGAGPDAEALDPVAVESKAIESMAETRCSWGTWQRYESKYENQYDKAWRNLLRWREAADRAEARRALTRGREIRNELESIKLPLDPPVPNPATAPNPVSNVQNAPAQQHTAPVTEPVPPQIGRNSPCPCGSREKYKRCCGKNAPPVLNNGSPAPLSRAA